MNSIYGQLNRGLDLNLDREAQDQTQNNGTNKLFMLKVEKNLNK